MRFTIGIALLIASVHAAGAEDYLCIPEHTTGFRYDRPTGAWITAEFRIAGTKYLLKRVSGKLRWTNFGKPVDLAPSCSEYNEVGFSNCSGLSEVTFNKQTLRFLLTHRLGYVRSEIDPKTEGDVTPFIEIGTCSAL